MLQGEKFLNQVLLGPRSGLSRSIDRPMLRILHTVHDAIGEERQLRNAARLTDNLRMTIYRLLTATETLEKVSVLSRRERRLISQSELAKQSKRLVMKIPASHWILPKPIPAYTLKVIDEITFKFKLTSMQGKQAKKLDVTDNLLALILSLPARFDDKKVSLDIISPGQSTHRLILFE